MKYFNRCNTLVGWGVFAISAIVYLMTMSPTADLWDCAEFIATSYKLEVGHPPGAPLFMMIARFFTMFAPSPDKVGMMVNAMSSLASAFTILFLFWSITHLARKIYAPKREQLTKSQIWTVMGAGAIGALAYTFTDSFWFSAVEGEVYALSSMFTAMVVWAMLKWEEVADQPHANRWLVLIAYLMGLSIGIHILNLLTIPALVFIYYFKKHPNTTKWGVVLATLVSGAILVGINYILVPYSVRIGAFIDRVFVNSLGAAPNVGITLFFFALFAAGAWGVYYTHKKGKKLANMIILCATVITLGYSSYASVVIRAAANPPMNSNNPNNPYALLALLEREQYGSRPLLYGPYHSSYPIEVTTERVYELDENQKYVGRERFSGYEYPSDLLTLFPRMYSSRHGDSYMAWVGAKGRQVPFNGKTITVPTAGENLRFFVSYQVNFMYWRYFMWNFVGRQSDIQSTGEITNGNWLSGVDAIDQIYLGPQKNLPSEMKDNKGRNTYFFLPFILGMIGLIYQLNRDRKNFVVVMWLFLMMGLVLVLYFNTPPGEPRERDYVFAGSFYAFSIWIGLGVMCIKELLDKITKKDTIITTVAATVICSSVPIILAAQNWDDHNRSGRYVARDVGWNYMQSTLPNSIIMNYGDNDTFPLWYVQEVEQVRPDVRIMNMSYLGGSWYIDEMKVRTNQSDAVPFSMPQSKHVDGVNDQVYVVDMFDGEAVEIKLVMEFFKSEDPRTKTSPDSTGEDFIPATKLALPVNRENVLATGLVKAEDAHLIEDTVYLTIKDQSLLKPDIMLLDMLANFDWKRPLYVTQAYSLGTLGLRDYLQFDGFAYRIVPIKTPVKTTLEIGRIDAEYLNDKLMNTFRFGNVKDPKVYTDFFIHNTFEATRSRASFARLAKALMEKGDTTRAVAALDRGVAEMPFTQIKHSYTLTVPIIEGYYIAGEFDKANEIVEDYAENLMEYIDYYLQFEGSKEALVEDALIEKYSILEQLYRVAFQFKQMEQVDMLEEFFDARDL